MRNSPARKWSRRFPEVAPALVAALALVLSGCFRTEIGIDVHDTKSVDITILMAFDMGSMSGFMPEGTGGDLFDQLDETPPFPVDTEQEVEIEPYDEDGYQGARYTIKDVPLDEVQNLLGSDTFELEWGPGGGRFEATASMEGLPGVGDLTESLPGLGDLGGDLGGELGGELPPDTPEGLGNLDDLGAQMDQFLTQGMQDMSVSFSVTMPGPVEENNGTEVRGNTVVWKYSGEQLQSTETSVMSATWGPAGSTIPWMWIAIAGAGVLLVILVIVLVARRKRPEPAAAGEFPGEHGAGQPIHSQVQYPAQYTPGPPPQVDPHGGFAPAATPAATPTPTPTPTPPAPVGGAPDYQGYPSPQQSGGSGYEPPAPPSQTPTPPYDPVPDSYGQPPPEHEYPPPPPPPPPAPATDPGSQPAHHASPPQGPPRAPGPPRPPGPPPRP